jgi:formamidopyrimidine-DNA glycosylase
MPELPDVEAVRRYLVSWGLVGRTISGATLLWPRAIREPSPEQFLAAISGRRIGEVRRRGKYLVLALDGLPLRTLVLHLGMTGSLMVQPIDEDRPRHTRNILLLQNGLEVCFVDPRKLGSMRVVENESGLFLDLGLGP